MKHNRALSFSRMGLLITSLLVILALMACNSGANNKSTYSTSKPVPTKKWFEGGTLHNATIGEWNSATYANKLATSADWLAVTVWKGHLHSPNDFDKVRVKAEMLVTAVNGVVEDKDIDNLNVTEFAITLISMSNDLGP